MKKEIFKMIIGILLLIISPFYEKIIFQINNFYLFLFAYFILVVIVIGGLCFLSRGFGEYLTRERKTKSKRLENE